MIPRYSSQSVTLNPVAHSADSGEVLRPKEHYVPHSKLGELALALSKFSEPLHRTMLAKIAEENKADFLKGQDVAIIHKTWDEAINSGKADVTDSPFFRKGFMEAKGRTAGLGYIEHLNQAYELWEGKNHVSFVNDPLGSKTVNQDPFLEFVNQARQNYLHEHHEAQGDEDWHQGFRSKMKMAELNLLNHHVAVTQVRLRESRFHLLDQELSHLVSASLSSSELKKSITSLRQEALFTGLSEKDTDERIQNNLIITALELGGSHGSQILGVIDSKDPSVRQKVLQAEKHLENDMWQQEERTFRQKEHERSTFKKNFQTYLLKALLDNPGYQPSPDLEQEALRSGFIEFPKTVEHLRKQVLDYKVEHNVVKKEQFYADLYAGRLHEQGILDTSLLNPDEKAQALKTHFYQTDIVKHEAVRSAKHILTGAIAPNRLEALLVGTTEQGQRLTSLAAEATSEYHQEIWSLQRQNPELISDPIELSKQATGIANHLKAKYVALKDQVVDGTVPQTSTETGVNPSGSPHQAALKELFPTKTELKQALEEFKQGRGKLKDFVQTHSLSQEEFSHLLESLIEEQSQSQDLSISPAE